MSLLPLIHCATFAPFARGIHYAKVHDSATALVGFAGYAVEQSWADDWNAALGASFLSPGEVFSVMGPADPLYKGREIQTSHLLPALTSARVVLVAAHSSGSYVAHNWFHQLLDSGAAGKAVLARVAYFNLDGGLGDFDPGVSLNASVATALRSLHAVCSCVNTSLCSPNIQDMQTVKQRFPFASLFQIDASRSGCVATWCVHMTLINTKPFNSSGTDGPHDYTDFAPPHGLQTVQYRPTNSLK